MKTLIFSIIAATAIGTGLLIHFGEHEQAEWIEHDPGYALKLEGGLEIHP